MIIIIIKGNSMLLIETSKVFERAIKSQSVATIEKILQCSDCLDHLIKQYCQNNNSNDFLHMSKQFKSKGLKIRVQNSIEKHQNLYLQNHSFEQTKITLTHQGNKQHNANVLKQEQY
jgi:hypothetical protein